MSYHTGTIASATPGTDLMTVFTNALNAHSGWTFIETLTTGTDVSSVYRCNSATNGLGADFYIAVRVTSSTGSVNVYLFEEWDAVNKRAYKYAPASQENPVSVTQADGTQAGYYTLPTWVQTGGTFSINGGFAIGVITTGFTYWLSIQNDCIIATSTQTGYCQYIGMYENIFSATYQPPPHLINCRLNYTLAAPVNSVTRDSPLYASATHTWSASSMTNSYIGGQPAGKDVLGGEWVAHPFAVYHSKSNTATYGTTFVGIRGYIPLSRVAFMKMSEVAEGLGDTVTLNGDVHACFATDVWVNTEI